MLTTTDLAQRRCEACHAGMPKLGSSQIAQYLGALPEWKERENHIEKEFKFKDFYQTMAFVNAVAWVAHSENHHPDMEVGYNRCRVSYSTHAVGGLTDNDFICAAKVEALLSH